MVPATIEVAYFESDVKTRDDLGNGLQKLFESCGAPVNVRAVKTVDEVIADASNGRVDIFVCDLSLNSDEPLGLGILSEVKSKYPSVFTVSVSSKSAELTEVEMLPRKFDLFVPKSAISGRAFDKRPHYKERLFQRFRYSAIRTFNLRKKIQEIPENPPPSRAEMLDLLRQVISYRPPLEIASLIYDVELDQLGGGRSASYVFELIASLGTDRRRILPIVLKFSKMAQCLEEVRRYEVFVRWTLPHDMRVDMMAFGVSKEWGVVAYSFAHGQSGLRTLTDFMHSGDHRVVERTIDRIFDGGKAFWQSTKEDILYANLTQRYFERFFAGTPDWFNEDVKKVNAFLRSAMPEVKMGTSECAYLGRSFPSPVRLLQNGLAQELFDGKKIWSIVHGDMNPNNVVISDDGDVALIDFNDTGVGHCFEDAIALEAALRLFWPWKEQVATQADQAQILAREEDISEGRAPGGADHEAWNIIAKIRRRAAETFGREVQHDYYFGLAYYSFRLMRVGTLSQETKKRLFIVSLHAGVKSEEG